MSSDFSGLSLMKGFHVQQEKHWLPPKKATMFKQKCNFCIYNSSVYTQCQLTDKKVQKKSETSSWNYEEKRQKLQKFNFRQNIFLSFFLTDNLM